MRHTFHIPPVVQIPTSLPASFKWVTITAFAAIGALILGNAVFAQQEWPTPPPAPRSAVPIYETITTPAEAQSVQGAALWEIQPIPQGVIPIVPPVQGDTFQVPGQLRLTIEAGTLDRTLQLTYVPVPVQSLPTTRASQRPVKGFDLTFFNAQGQPIHPTINRPLILEISTDDLLPFGNDPNRLVFARFENGQWLPMLTSYFRTERQLVARLLKPGRFAVLTEQPLS